MNIFIERSLNSALDFLKEAVFSEGIAAKRGLLQAVGPRIKIVFLAAMLITACFVRSIPHLLIIYAGTVVLALFSGVGALYFLKRVWIFIPLFTAVIAIPAIFIQDLRTAVLFVTRVATCVSLVVLVTVTTRHSQILRSLRSFGVPAIFVQVLDMTYRYVFLFIKIFEETHQALKARLVGKMRGRAGREWVAGRMGSMFRRSMRMSEEVYMAMIARGYRGE